MTPMREDTTPRSQITRGALAMAASSLCFVLMDAILREMAKVHGTGMVVWARYAMQVLFVFALFPIFGARRAVTTARPYLHIARGALLVTTTICLVMALRELPFAQTYAITLSYPIVATLLAFIFLSERPTAVMMALILVGFVGVLIVLAPGSPQASVAALWALAMALANACLHVLTRFMGKDEDPMALLFYIGLAALALTSLGLPWYWQALPWDAWAWMALVGFFGTGAHILMVEAYRLAPTAVVAPMVYLQLVWAALLAYLVFAEIPATSTMIGAGLVVAAGILLVRIAIKRGT